MESAQPMVAPEAPLGEGGEPAGHVAGNDGALHEAMLTAIGELSDEERERLSSTDQPVDVANAWRDLIAERAAREREQSVRDELTREFESQIRSARQRPTSGLRGGAPKPQPSNVNEWTDFIRSAEGQELRQQRRAQFATWLAAHPEA